MIVNLGEHPPKHVWLAVWETVEFFYSFKLAAHAGRWFEHCFVPFCLVLMQNPKETCTNEFSKSKRVGLVSILECEFFHVL